MSANGVVYHHVGTGHTTSRYWCAVCDGYYGVPHDGDVHSSRHKQRADCACAPCQKRAGTYPTGGIFMDHADYLAMRERGDVPVAVTMTGEDERVPLSARRWDWSAPEMDAAGWVWPDCPQWPRFVLLPRVERARIGAQVAAGRLAAAWRVLVGRTPLRDDGGQQ